MLLWTFVDLLRALWTLYNTIAMRHLVTCSLDTNLDKKRTQDAWS